MKEKKGIIAENAIDTQKQHISQALVSLLNYCLVLPCELIIDIPSSDNSIILNSSSALIIGHALEIKVVVFAHAQNAVVLPSKLISILISSLSCPIGSNLSRDRPIVPLKIGIQTVK